MFQIKKGNPNILPFYIPFHGSVEKYEYDSPAELSDIISTGSVNLNVELKIVCGIKTLTNELTSNISRYSECESAIEHIFAFTSKKVKIGSVPDYIIWNGIKRKNPFAIDEYEIKMENVESSQEFWTGEKVLDYWLNYLATIPICPYFSLGLSDMKEYIINMMVDPELNAMIFPVVNLKFTTKRTSFKSVEFIETFSRDCGIPATIIYEKQDITFM
jgi:hypothetical protein